MCLPIEALSQAKLSDPMCGEGDHSALRLIDPESFHIVLPYHNEVEARYSQRTSGRTDARIIIIIYLQRGDPLDLPEVGAQDVKWLIFLQLVAGDAIFGRYDFVATGSRLWPPYQIPSLTHRRPLLLPSHAIW